MISMNIIYLDTLFFVNFICDYILFLCAARVGGSAIRRIPIFTASCAGALYACLCCLPNISWIAHPFIKSSVSVFLCIIAFGKEKNLLRCTIIFLCISAMAGGLLSAVAIHYGTLQYLPIQAKTLFLTFALIYTILNIFFRNIPQFSRREYHQVTVFLNGKSVSFLALRDSGNELCDPITNRPVLVCQPNAINSLFSTAPDWCADPYDLLFRLNQTQECENRILLIPCRTVTGSGMLLGIKVDEVFINGHSEPYIVAISKERFQAESPYQAIY